MNLIRNYTLLLLCFLCVHSVVLVGCDSDKDINKEKLKKEQEEKLKKEQEEKLKKEQEEKRKIADLLQEKVKWEKSLPSSEDILKGGFPDDDEIFETYIKNVSAFDKELLADRVKDKSKSYFEEKTIMAMDKHIEAKGYKNKENIYIGHKNFKNLHVNLKDLLENYASLDEGKRLIFSAFYIIEKEAKRDDKKQIKEPLKTSKDYIIYIKKEDGSLSTLFNIDLNYYWLSSDEGNCHGDLKIFI